MAFKDSLSNRFDYLNRFEVNRKSVISRHDEERNLIEASTPVHNTIIKEQRFGNLQPDLIIQNKKKQSTLVPDIKISAEASKTQEQNDTDVATKY